MVFWPLVRSRMSIPIGGNASRSTVTLGIVVPTMDGTAAKLRTAATTDHNTQRPSSAAVSSSRQRQTTTRSGSRQLAAVSGSRRRRALW